VRSPEHLQGRQLLYVPSDTCVLILRHQSVEGPGELTFECMGVLLELVDHSELQMRQLGLQVGEQLGPQGDQVQGQVAVDHRLGREEV
jgi:hypothetical protein